MHLPVKAAALAVLIWGAALATASGAETAPAGDPGQEIKEGAVAFGHGVRDGAVKFGHGVRDGAVRGWGAVKSTVQNGGKAADKPQKRTPQKDSSKESK
jgi:hypothetical protein